MLGEEVDKTLLSIEQRFSCNPFANTKEGAFVIPSDLQELDDFRFFFGNLCKKLSLSEKQRFEIILIADELVSNALLESKKKNQQEDILFYYKINEGSCLCMNIMDFCGGFDPDILKEKTSPNVHAYLKEALRYQKKKNQINFNNGKAKVFRRLGKGLQLVQHFSSTFQILFHNSLGEISSQQTADTSGSIIKISYCF